MLVFTPQSYVEKHNSKLLPEIRSFRYNTEGKANVFEMAFHVVKNKSFRCHATMFELFLKTFALTSFLQNNFV